MSIEQAYKLTLNEVMIMQLGKSREYEKHMQGVRLIMWEIRTKYIKKGRTIAPQDIFKLSIDTEENEKPKRMSKEEFLNKSI